MVASAAEPEVKKRDSDKDAGEADETLQGVREELGIGESIDPLEAILNLGVSPTEVTDTFDVPLADKTVVPWTLRVISQDEIDALDERCTRMVKQGRGPRIKERDGNKFMRLVVATATTSPDLTDPRLKKKFGQLEPERMVAKILLPGTIENVSSKTLELSGYTGEDLVATAGN